MTDAVSISQDDLALLRNAKETLENPSLAAKLQNALGKPIEEGMKWLPERWSDVIHNSTNAAITKALDVAAKSLFAEKSKGPSNTLHKVLVAASGAAGGAFGIVSLPVELPVSTVIMLRSIADIARSEGEDVQSLEARLSCLEVFALGGKGSAAEAAETGYFAVRTILSKELTDVAKYLAKSGATSASAPALMRFVSSIASRFGVVVSQKTIAGAVPIIGAAGGALINTIFIGHFQDMARGHFCVRRLERKYGKEIVREAYDTMPI